MKRLYYVFFLVLLVASSNALATTHTISFGGSLGTKYDPKSLTDVQVGDIIMWVAEPGTDFATHPLQSTQVPTGAAPWGEINTGTTFSYTVTVAGDYAYQCNIHAGPPFNMNGTFTASAVGSVEKPVAMTMTMDPVYPNPSMGDAMVHFTLKSPSHITLRIFDATGKLTLTVANEQMTAGFHMLTIDTKQLTSGSYQYILQSDEAILRRAAIVVK